MTITKLQQGLWQFASASAIRPELHAVMTDGKTAVATDSFRLVEITLDENVEVQEPVLLESKALKGAKIKEIATVADENGKKYVVGEEGTTLVPEMGKADGYPKYKVIMDEAAKREYIEVNLNGHFLAQIAKHLSRFDSREKVVLKVPKDALQPVIITAEGTGQKAYAMLMPLTR